MTEQEFREVGALADGGGYLVWLGGTDQKEEGVWRWNDGSTWNFTRWSNGTGSRGVGKDCVLMIENKEWWDYSCTEIKPFVCQSIATKMSGKSVSTMNYTKEQLSFNSFSVGYSYRHEQGLLDSWENKRMTGFRLSWYLQDTYGTNINEMKSDMPVNWMPANAKVPRSINPFLTRAVQLASLSRLTNLSSVATIKRAIKEKADIVQSGYIDYNNMCTDGQI